MVLPAPCRPQSIKTTGRSERCGICVIHRTSIGDEFFVDVLDDLLGRVDARGHVLAERLRFDAVDEVGERP